MIYFIRAQRVEFNGENYHSRNGKGWDIPMPLMIEAQSSRDAMEHAKEIVADIYDGDVSVAVFTEDKFKTPMFNGVEQEDSFILLECWRKSGKWNYCI